MAKVIAYLLLDGDKVHREFQVDLKADHVTGVAALAAASAYAVEHPDKRVSLEIITA